MCVCVCAYSVCAYSVCMAPHLEHKEVLGLDKNAQGFQVGLVLGLGDSLRDCKWEEATNRQWARPVCTAAVPDRLHLPEGNHPNVCCIRSHV